MLKNCLLLHFLFFGVIMAKNKERLYSTNSTTPEKQQTSEFQAPVFRESTQEVSSRPIHIKVGERFRLLCRVQGNPTPVVYFYKKSKLLSNDNANELDISENSLRIKSAKLSDSGIYTCEANNSIGSTSLNFDISVDKGTPEPYWLYPDRMEKILHAEPAGNTVKFVCQAGGAKPLTAKWYKGDKFIINKDERMGGYKFQRKNQVIQLESVVPSDVGQYTCVISNKFGSINHSYELDVAERSASKPIMMDAFLQNQTVYVGANVTFQCKWHSDTHPHVEWLKIVSKSNSTPEVTPLKKAGVNTTNEDMKILKLYNVSYKDEAEYACVAGNAIGISHASAFLKVLPIPAPDPTSVTSESATKNHFLIYAFGGIFAVIIVIFIIYLGYSNLAKKDPPRLVPIEDPEKIPHLTKLEEPRMLIGNDQAWKRMGAVDHIEIKIQADLQWELKRSNIQLEERIDEGFFGQVYKAQLTHYNNGREEKIEAAVKMLKTSHSEKDLFDLLSEMDQMKRVGKHTNIVSLLGVCTQDGVLWLVTEYAQQGNLRDYLRRNRPLDMQYQISAPNAPSPRANPLSQKDLMSAAYQVARGMEYLSQKKCIHRDLAARNILVSNDYVMKIADFGLARDILKQDYYRKHTRGHLPYKWMALEAMTDNVFTSATDVWSFGVLLWEIFSLGGSPYPGVKTHELVRLLRHGERLDQPQFASLELYRLMRDCWEEKPQRRPKFRQLVEDLDRMLSDTSSSDYIDLRFPLESKFSLSESEESGIDDQGESSRDSANATGEDSDSVFEHNNRETIDVDLDHSYAEDHDPLLPDGGQVLRNDHARLQSDV